MAISRYRNVSLISGSYYSTFDFPKADLNKIATFTIVPTSEDRLDTLAAKYLGSGQYWWVIAFLNDIDWGFSFEEGSTLYIPVNLDDVLRLF